MGLCAALLRRMASQGADTAAPAAADGTMGHPAAAGAGGSCPRLILCTHFHELFRPGILPRSPRIAFWQMEVLHGPGAEVEGEGVGQRQQQPQGQECVDQALTECHVFLYRLVPGQCPASFGVHCARLAGVPETTCGRAQVRRRAPLGIVCERVSCVHHDRIMSCALQESRRSPPTTVPPSLARRCPGDTTHWPVTVLMEPHNQDTRHPPARHTTSHCQLHVAMPMRRKSFGRCSRAARCAPPLASWRRRAYGSSCGGWRR